MRHRLNAYELVPAADWTWIADSQEDVFGNRRTYPLGIPLCCGCDGPATEGKCHSCEVEFCEQLTVCHGGPFLNQARAE